ncbi:hypothetical protein ACFSQ3_04540 [Sphingobacterium corticis]|uniref:Uncharacterized protein n=1 Tax=Sphingobacterium corticis TaxID=1812823 RepID=A0ABW5NGX1_9SPHI
MKKATLVVVMMMLVAFCAEAQRPHTTNPMKEHLEALNAIKNADSLQKELDRLTTGEQEDDHLIAYQYFIKNADQERADKLKAVILQKFPRGSMAKQTMIEKITGEPDLLERDRLFSKMAEERPDEEFGYLPFMMAQDFANVGNEANMTKYANIYARSAVDGKGNPVSKEFIYSLVAEGMIRTNPDIAAKYLKGGMEENKKSLDQMLAEGGSDSNLLKRAKSNYYNATNSYVDALLKGSDPEKGYVIAADMYKKLKSDPTEERSLFLINRKSIYVCIAIYKPFQRSFSIRGKRVAFGFHFTSDYRSFKTDLLGSKRERRRI